MCSKNWFDGRRCLRWWVGEVVSTEGGRVGHRTVFSVWALKPRVMENAKGKTSGCIGVQEVLPALSLNVLILAV